MSSAASLVTFLESLGGEIGERHGCSIHFLFAAAELDGCGNLALSRVRGNLLLAYTHIRSLLEVTSTKMDPDENKSPSAKLVQIHIGLREAYRWLSERIHTGSVVLSTVSELLAIFNSVPGLMALLKKAYYGPVESACIETKEHKQGLFNLRTKALYIAYDIIGDGGAFCRTV